MGDRRLTDCKWVGTVLGGIEGVINCWISRHARGAYADPLISRVPLNLGLP